MPDNITGTSIYVAGYPIPQNIFGVAGVLLWCSIFIKTEPSITRYSLIALAILLLLLSTVLKKTIA